MRDAYPPWGPNSFNFMQFFGKFGKFVCWHPPGELAPPPWGNPGSATGNVFTPVCHSVPGGLSASPHDQRQTPPLSRQPRADSPWADIPLLPSACWDTPPCQCILRYTPPAQCMLGYPPPCTVHAGIRSTSGRYASYWNAYLLEKKIPFNTKERKTSVSQHLADLTKKSRVRRINSRQLAVHCICQVLWVTNVTCLNRQKVRRGN